MSCGYAHSAALCDTYEVRLWGWRSGYLPCISLVSPLNLPCISATSPLHEVLLWGSGWKGKLGTADDVNRLVPTPVPSLKRKHLQLIVCGSFHTIALSEGGDIFTWGIGERG